MPDKTSSSEQPQVGMITDNAALASRKGSWSYALNTNVESLDGNGLPIPQNEHSNFLSVTFPAGFVVISHKYIKEKDRVIYFLVNPVSKVSQIGESAVSKCFIANTQDLELKTDCVDCGGYEYAEPAGVEQQPVKSCAEYYPFVVSDCLGFDYNYPIDVEYKLTNKDLRLYFTDALNQRRFLYLDFGTSGHLQVQKEFNKVLYFDAACNAPVYSSEIDCNKIQVQPAISRGCAMISDIITGGQCQSATYQFFLAYADVNGNQLSEYFQGTNQVPIHSHDVVVQDDLPTDKGILLGIVGLDYSSYYRYYNIAVAKTTNGQVTLYKVATLPIGVRSFFYTDNWVTYLPLTENDILKRPAYYKTAEFVTSSNGILYWGGMKEFARGNWQRVANQIKVGWQTEQIPLGSYILPQVAEKYRSLMRDEVVPVGIIFEFDNGEETDVLHIPGRAPAPADMEPVAVGDQIDVEGCSQEDLNQKWRAYSTATVDQRPHATYDPCSTRIWEYGTFGYWESSSAYPDNELVWGELRCNPIRHHKVPDISISPLYDGLDSNNPFEVNPMVYPIGLRIDHQSVYTAINNAITQGYITPEMMKRLSGYRLVRGNRNGNESIVAKGLMYDVWGYDKDNTHYYYPNYPFNDVRDDPFIGSSSQTYDFPDSSIDPYKNKFSNTGRYTFHSPDTHFRNPGIGAELKIEAIAYGQSSGFFNKVDKHAKYKFLTTFAHLIAAAVGFAAAQSQDKKVCMSYNRLGGEADIGLLPKVTEPLPAIANPLYGGIIPNYSSFGGEDALSHEVTYQQCTGRFRDFLPAPHLLLTGNLWRAGVLIGPNPAIFGPDFNVLGVVLTAMMGAPRLWYDIHNAFIEIDRFITTLEVLVPYRNMAWQYQAVGKYNNYTLPAEGDIRRKITDYAYLRPDVTRIAEKDINNTSQTVHFNNYRRESALYFKVDRTLPTASTYKEDTSRFLASEAGLCSHKSDQVRSNVSSYYASLRSPRLDQYGTVYDIDYLETGHCSFKYYQDQNINRALDYSTVFGGDTFISLFALKRKHSFFIDTAFELPDGADFKYPDYANAGFPNFYIMSRETVGERLTRLEIGDLLNLKKILQDINDLIGTERNRYDCQDNKFIYQDGMFYLFSYGIPYFICESTINTDLRTARDTKAGDFYPRQQDLAWWLQQKNVSISEDNQYHYNKDYSAQNTLTKAGPLSPSFIPMLKDIARDNLLIYATDQEGDNSVTGQDRWLQNLVADAYEFPMSDGKMVSAEGIENDKVLVRFEDNMKVFNSYVTINTSADKAILSTGDIFRSKPQEFSRTDTGHLGTQHKAILNTPFGHITIDAQRGNIFLLPPGQGGVDDLAAHGNTDWFQENLPFQIKRDFPYIPDSFLDNSYRKLGIALGFDKRFKRLFVTKHDYKVLRNDIIWENGEFYIVHKRKVLITQITKSCPEGFTLNQAATVCTKPGTPVLATRTGDETPFVGVAKTLDNYNRLGSIIYSSVDTSGVPTGGEGRFPNGTFYHIPEENNFWNNTSRNTTDGPLNRCGIWSDAAVDPDGNHLPINTWVGATVPLTFSEPTTIYVGASCDNQIRIRIGCDLVVQQDADKMDQALGLVNYSDYLTEWFRTSPFAWWHIYPVHVPAGTTFLEVSGYNWGLQASFGAEIYNNTYEEIIAATGYNDLKVIWSTEELKGKVVDNFQYTCQDCSPMVLVDGKYYCIEPDEAVPPIITTTVTEQEVIEKEWVCLQNPRYFCDRSWTAAFRLDYKFMIGFYSWHPNFYTGFDSFFQVGINTPCRVNMFSSVWSHLLTNKSYQVFFGRLHPWEVEPVSDPRPDFTILEYISFKAEFWRYLTEETRTLKQNVTFNKVMVYTDRACSGTLKLHLNGNDHSIRYPYLETDGSALNIKVDYHEGQYSFNYLYDHTHSQYNNVPFLITNCGNWKKELNNRSVNYLKQSRLTGRLRSELFHIRLTNDVYSNYKILLHWCNFFTSQSNV